ncbi:MAG: APC family permease [Gemmatimonadetes bacterium]|nr:APC family permease [Candidatus Palauibacter rhopaloidicola]
MTEPTTRSATPDAGGEREVLGRGIRLRSLFSLAFGTIIGVGWITVMGAWLSGAGAIGAIIAFVLGGLGILAIGLCYSEMAAAYPVTGGEVAYVFEAWGARWSFAAAWFLAFSYIFTTSFEAISVEWVVSALVPGFGGPVIYTLLGQEVRLWSLALGLAVMAAITFINYRGGKTAAWFQDLMTAGLIILTLIFVVAGVVGGSVANLEPMFSGTTPGAALVGVGIVLGTAAFWFAGFDTIPQAMEEVEEGAKLRLLPRVMGASILFALVFYCLVILATAMSMPRAELLASELPAAAAIEAALGSPFLGRVVLFAGLCGLITTWNAIFFASTRIVFAMARAHMIPHRLAKVHDRYGSPSAAVIFVAVMGSVGALFGRNAILVIVGGAAISAMIVFLVVVLGVLRLRKTRPHHPRPYTVPGGRGFLYLSAVVALGLLGASIWEPFHGAGGRIPAEWIVLVVWAALGLVFYRAAAPLRREVSARQLRWLILSDEDPE